MTAWFTQKDEYRRLRERLLAGGIDVDGVERRLERQRVEIPTWAFGAFGTRFFTFHPAGQAHTFAEKLRDAVEVQRLLGICGSLAVHIPWDAAPDYGQMRAQIEAAGLTVGSVAPNLFQDEDYRLGSVANPDPRIREKALGQIRESIEVARALRARSLSLWLADGTNYAGQDSFTERRERLIDAYRATHDALDPEMRMLVEYKYFEPAFYATDLPDWGTALRVCEEAGERARVLVDLGHHPQGANIEQIVAHLADLGRLGGFHFNNRKYADDDLVVGSANPFELFLIYTELAAAEDRVPGSMADVSYALDQCHNVESNLEAVVWSVLNLQHAYARALLVDRVALVEAQRQGDVMGAHRLLVEAFETDVRPICAAVRERVGGTADPIAALREGGYVERVAGERGAGDRR